MKYRQKRFDYRFATARQGPNMQAILGQGLFKAFHMRTRPIVCKRGSVSIEKLRDILRGQMTFARGVVAKLGFQCGEVVCSSEFQPRHLLESLDVWKQLETQRVLLNIGISTGI